MLTMMHLRRQSSLNNMVWYGNDMQFKYGQNFAILQATYDRANTIKPQLMVFLEEESF